MAKRRKKTQRRKKGNMVQMLALAVGAYLIYTQVMKPSNSGGLTTAPPVQAPAGSPQLAKRRY